MAKFCFLCGKDWDFKYHISGLQEGRTDTAWEPSQSKSCLQFWKLTPSKFPDFQFQTKVCLPLGVRTEGRGRRDEISQDKARLIKGPQVISLQRERRMSEEGEGSRFKPANHVCIKFPFRAADKRLEGLFEIQSGWVMVKRALQSVKPQLYARCHPTAVLTRSVSRRRTL